MEEREGSVEKAAGGKEGKRKKERGREPPGESSPCDPQRIREKKKRKGESECKSKKNGGKLEGGGEKRKGRDTLCVERFLPLAACGFEEGDEEKKRKCANLKNSEGRGEKEKKGGKKDTEPSLFSCGKGKKKKGGRKRESGGGKKRRKGGDGPLNSSFYPKKKEEGTEQLKKEKKEEPASAALIRQFG